MLGTSNLDFHHRLIEQADDIKPMPASVIRLATAVADTASSIEDIVSIVREDPALASVILREANSATSASKSNISDISEAVVRIGAARTLAIAVGASIAEDYKPELGGYGLEQGDLSTHSSLASYIVEAIRPLSKRALGPEVVTAALLHDFGKIVLSDFAEPALLEGALSHSHHLASAERELYDIDHAELGAMLAHRWGLPDSLCETIRHHHDPENGSSDLAHAVLIADHLAHEFGPPSMHDETEQAAALEKSLTYLGLDFDDVHRVAQDRLLRLGIIEDDS